MRLIIMQDLILRPLHMAYHKDQSSDHYFLLYTYMTFMGPPLYCFQSYLQMTPVC